MTGYAKLKGKICSWTFSLISGLSRYAVAGVGCCADVGLVDLWALTSGAGTLGNHLYEKTSVWVIIKL